MGMLQKFVAGAANGSLTLGEALRSGRDAAVSVLDLQAVDAAPDASDEPAAAAAFWHVADSKGRAWVDLQNDVTVKDVKQSQREGFRSVEHLKRYTTLGMATDQGKTSNISALAVMARDLLDCVSRPSVAFRNWGVRCSPPLPMTAVATASCSGVASM